MSSKLRSGCVLCLITALALAALLCAACDNDEQHGDEDDTGVGSKDAAMDGALPDTNVTPDLACHGDMTQVCYNGPKGTQGVGLCAAGAAGCVAGAWDTKCAGQVIPAKEQCDGKDNDCDGLADEGLAKYCYTGPAGTDGKGLCQQGLQICATGKWGMCVGQVTPGTETCDNKDNDCDGKVDNGLSQACYSGPAATKGKGECKDGTQVCAAGQWGGCSGEVTPTPEKCGDNKDGDCDGKPDATDPDCLGD